MVERVFAKHEIPSSTPGQETMKIIATVPKVTNACPYCFMVTDENGQQFVCSGQCAKVTAKTTLCALKKVQMN